MCVMLVLSVVVFLLSVFYLFFCFKQKTAYEMRISDWSSDVCSSDLDAHDDGKPSLRSHGEVINNHLRDEIQARLEKAGVQVIESRISHLAYAQEIAQAIDRKSVV